MNTREKHPIANSEQPARRDDLIAKLAEVEEGVCGNE